MVAVAVTCARRSDIGDPPLSEKIEAGETVAEDARLPGDGITRGGESEPGGETPSLAGQEDTAHPAVADSIPAVEDEIRPSGIDTTMAALPAGSLSPGEPDTVLRPLQTVLYSAETIDYRITDKTIHLDGHSRLSYQTMELEAGSIDLDTEHNLLTAVTDPVLKDGPDIMIGEEMIYNIDTKIGIVHDGVTEVEDGICTGEEIRKVDEATLNIVEGSYSTCKLKDPHYLLSCRRLRIIRDDKAIAKPVIMKIEEVPVFYMPFYIFSVKKGRHSGLLIPHYNEDLVHGRYLSNVGYYWAANDYMDLKAESDMYEEGRLRLDLHYRYALRYVIPSAYVKSNIDLDPLNESRRYSLNFNHSQLAPGDLTVRATSNCNAHERGAGSSDSRSWNNNLTLTRKWQDVGTVSVKLLSNRNLEDGYKTEYMPSITLSGVSTPFIAPGEIEYGDAEIHWYNKISQQTKGAFTRSRIIKSSGYEARNAAEVKSTISSSQMVGGWLSFPTYFTFATAVFNNRPVYDETGTEVSTEWGTFPRAYAYANTKLGTKIRGLYSPNYRWLRGILHTVQPSLHFYYTPDYSNYFTSYSYEQGGRRYSGERNRFYSVSSISSTPGEKREMNYSLSNMLDIKWQGEEREEKRKLTSLTLGGNYDFLAEGEGFSDVNVSYGLTPLENTSFSLSTRWNPYEREWGTVSTTSRVSLSGQGAGDEAETYIQDLLREEDEGGEASPEERLIGPDSFYEDPLAPAPPRPWRLSGSWIWSRTPTGIVSSSVSGSADFHLTRNWHLNVHAGYDIEDREFTSQSVRVVRDLHCWELVFDWHRYGDIWNYNLLIRIKKLPEIKFERREHFY